MSLERRIADNLAEVRGRIAAAAQRSGRRATDVTLVAVTKYVPAEVAQALAAAGCRDWGESRPQELWSKATRLADAGIRWHLVGHLQRNKIRRTLPLATLIQSVDSLRLLTAIDEVAGELGPTAAVLLEVNISGDDTKTGLAPGDIEPLIRAAAELQHVSIHGLMGMASLEGGGDAARRDFTRLRALRDQLATNCPANVSLDELSMGMSGDLEIALVEGATIVRVGSALFEGI
jgi:pyridoxal phosphate enzyme (YggS family)